MVYTTELIETTLLPAARISNVAFSSMSQVARNFDTIIDRSATLQGALFMGPDHINKPAHIVECDQTESWAMYVFQCVTKCSSPNAQH